MFWLKKFLFFSPNFEKSVKFHIQRDKLFSEFIFALNKNLALFFHKDYVHWLHVYNNLFSLHIIFSRLHIIFFFPYHNTTPTQFLFSPMVLFKKNYNTMSHQLYSYFYFILLWLHLISKKDEFFSVFKWNETNIYL